MSDDFLQPDDADDTNEHLAADAGLDEDDLGNPDGDGLSGPEHLGATPPD